MPKTSDKKGGNPDLPCASQAPISSIEIRDATEEEAKNLPHVSDKLSRTVWIAIIVGSTERLTYYAVTAPWQNYMQNGPGESAVPGALGLGQSRATTIWNSFYFCTFLSPVLFAIISDAWLGRFKTLCLSMGLYACGCLILFVTSLPTVLRRGGGLPGFVVSLVLIGLGVGGTKSTITPFIGDQYEISTPQLKTKKSGKQVILNRTLTLQYIYNVFYWFTNIAALSILPSTYLEKERGFWTAYLMAMCALWIGIALLLVFRKEFTKLPPNGNVLPKAGRVLICAMRAKFNLDAAKPQHQLERYDRTVHWTAEFVEEIRRGLLACRVMAWFVLFYLGFNQISNNLISQAAEMRLGGFPNDGIQVMSPIACVILGPFIQKVLYPGLARYRISFGPIARMAMAFLTMGASMAYAAGVQKLIYNQGPCYDAPLRCVAAQRGDGGPPLPNSISVWVQTPIYVIMAFAEILGFTTLSEYSYSKAPRDLRTVVQALRQVTAGVGSALGMALSPVAEDPKVLWLYVGLAVSLGLITPLFWSRMARYDREDEKLNALGLEPDNEQNQVRDTVSGEKRA